MSAATSSSSSSTLSMADESSWTEEAIDRQLANIYYAAGDPGSYGGVTRLFERAQHVGIPVTRERVREFIEAQVTYGLHKPVRHTFRRNQTVVHDKDEQWQADLAVLQDLASDNDGYKYILTCIDVLTRYAWAVPVKSKGAHDMLIAMRRLFKEAAPRTPKRMQTDKGVEFHNSQVRKFLAEHGVEHFSTNSDQKAALVERFNRTLKERMYKYFTANDTRRYVDILDDLVYAYNHSYHRTIGMPPAEVDTDKDVHDVWRRVYYDSREAQVSAQRNTLHSPLTSGDSVRMSRWKGTFEKGYVPNWSREQFKVTDARAAREGGAPRVVYKLNDKQGEPIEGYAYAEEVQPVRDTTADVLEIQRVLRTRRVGKRNTKETLVKWKGWPDKFNRWLKEEQLAQYSKPLRSQQQQQ